MHLNTEMLRLSSGIELQPIAYKGVPPGMPDLLTGRLAFAMSPCPSPAPSRADRCAPSGCFADPRERSADVPTFAEAGFPMRRSCLGTLSSRRRRRQQPFGSS